MGKADEGLGGVTPGDVIIELALVPHKHFKLLPNGDLILERRVNFGDAICGIHEDVTHLNGEHLRIIAKDIVQNGDVRKIPGKGMPRPHGGREGAYGDLYVRFTVNQPPKSPWKNEEEREEFRRKLGDKP